MKKIIILAALLAATPAKADKIYFNAGSYTAFKALSKQLAGPLPGFVWFSYCPDVSNGTTAYSLWQAWTINGFHVTGRTIMIIHVNVLGVPNQSAQPPTFNGDFPEAVNIDCSSGPYPTSID